MNFFDLSIIRFFNSFAQRSSGFDHLVVQISHNTLVRGGFMVALFVWAWNRLGSIAFCYSIFVISLPRIYLGIHHPTDIIGGAVIGIGVACLSRVVWLRKRVTRPVLQWSTANPPAFNALMFLLSFEIAELFESVRHIGLAGYHSVQVILQTLK